VQTLTTLHKQNFDLKLELFHRRERQTALEDRVENLEAEKNELDVLNDKLMAELEMRDKAVEEAVAMIIGLEARLEQLVQERAMVRQVESDGFFTSSLPPRDIVTDSMPTPKPKLLGAAATNAAEDDDVKAVARMPSFLSDHSENTENLRNVYLGVRGSILSLPRMSEDAIDGDDGRAANNMTDHDMSVLSESSFLSVYGQKPKSHSLSSPPRDPLPADEPLESRQQAARSRSGSNKSSRGKAGTPSKPRRSGSITRNNASSTFSSITELLDMNYSPLQRLENMEKSLLAMNEASRPGSKERESEVELLLARHLKSQPQLRTKQEKREALRKVRTDAPFTRDLGNHHNLPPTPDTISTSTLRRYKNSNDTLSRENKGTDERSYLALSEVTSSKLSSGDKGGASDVNGNQASHPPSTTAFNSRREHSVASSYFDNRLPIPPRPRSADETTVSHPGRGANGWDSDSSDELDGNDSASLHDYWLRESLRPTGAKPAGQHGGGKYDRKGRTSPDLFSFPATTGGWATEAMFGTLGGTGFLGAGSPPLSQTLDALGDSLPAPQNGLFGSGLASPGPNGAVIPPPPPNRRSSLHAQTGSTSASAGTGPGNANSAGAANPRVRKSPVRVSTPRAGSRSSSSDRRPSSAGRIGAAQLPQPQQQQAQASLPKQRQYPPLSGSTNSPRGRGLNIFRRSGSHEPPAPSSAPATETTFASAAASKKMQMPLVGVPSWGRRNDLQDDDRASATPPPILRNPRLSGRGSVDSNAGDFPAAAPLRSSLGPPAPPAKDVVVSTFAEAADELAGGAGGGQVNTNGGGGRRKWLGLGRVGSLRNRAG